MNEIKDTLHNTSAKVNSDPMYCRGLVVGIVAGLRSRGWSFLEAIAHIKERLPRDVDPMRLPEAFRVILMEGR